MKPSKLFIGALLCITSLSALAIEEDLLQKVQISAANQFADIKNKRVVYGGPVTVTQGSLKLLADELTAYTEDKSGERILVAKAHPLPIPRNWKTAVWPVPRPKRSTTT